MGKKDYKGNVAAQAWDAVKDDSDPPYEEIPNLSFKENLDYWAAKVRETGLAITNFEKEVAKILAAEPDVVEATIDFVAAAEGQVEGGPSSSEDTVVEEPEAIVEVVAKPTEVELLVKNNTRVKLEKIAKKAGLDKNAVNSYMSKPELATAILAAQQK